MLFFSFLLFSYFPVYFSLVHCYDVFESSSKNLSYVSMLQTNKKDKEIKKTSKKEKGNKEKKGKKENKEKHRKRIPTERNKDRRCRNK